MKIMILLLTVILSVISCQSQETERVVLLGIDALSTDGLQSAKTPNLNRLIRDGALSLKARGVMPTVSAPNWGSMLTGAGPEQHGITDNGWTVDNYTLEATLYDEDGYFPSIFNVIKDQKSGLKTAIFYDWKALIDLFNEKFIDKVELLSSYEEVYDKAIDYVISERPEFTFIYVGYVDEVGHKHQHGSEMYYEAIENVDAKVGELITALESENIYESTTIIVISDHGGVGYGHGGESLAEIQVPWIIKGPGTIKNKLIDQPINTYYTASTIAYLFGIEQHRHWTGIPVYGAFQDHEVSSANNKVYIPKPKASVKSGIHTNSQELSFSVDNKNTEIRYSLDGDDPDKNSALYTEPLILNETRTIKAISVMNNNKSDIEIVEFIKVLDVENVKLINQPSSKYPAEYGGKSLIDGILGNDDHNHSAWMGFEVDDLIAVIDLGTPKKFDKISISCMENINSWIFLPTEVEIYGSNNNINYKKIATLDTAEIESPLKRNRVLIKREFNDMKYRYIKVIASNIKYCPEDHSGAGGKAWLFVDEIIVE